MTTGELGLAEAIEAVREELHKAEVQGDESASEVHFVVGSVELEFAVDLTKAGGGGVSVKVLGVVDLGGKGEVSATNAHRVKIELSPVDKDGKPLKVAADLPQRPD